MKSNFTVAMVWALGSAFGAHAQNDTILTRSPRDVVKPAIVFNAKELQISPRSLLKVPFQIINKDSRNKIVAGWMEGKLFDGKTRDRTALVKRISVESLGPGARKEGTFEFLYDKSIRNPTVELSFFGIEAIQRHKESGKAIYSASLLTTLTQPIPLAKHRFDDDGDGIGDALEKNLLQRFRPYFMFSDDDGDDEYRPCDAWRYVTLSELRTNTNQDDNSGIFVPRTVLAGDPNGLLVQTGMFGSSDVDSNKAIVNYYINPIEKIEGESDDPGRHGNSWEEELLKKNIGLYGHVVPVRLCDPNYFDFNHVLNGSDDGKTYFKIEYWQFFGYNNAHQSQIADHEGDWTSVQLLFDPETDKLISVFHFAHGLDFRFNFNAVIDVRHLSNNDGPVDEFRGYNYNTDIDLVFHDLDFEAKKNDWQNAQNNVVRMFRDSVTGEFSHPVVYIENGGHEFYPTEDWNFYLAPSHNGKSHNFLTNTPPNLGEVEATLEETAAAGIILKFNGYWGTWSRKNSPPPGPALHKNWTWPESSKIRWELKNLGF